MPLNLFKRRRAVSVDSLVPPHRYRGPKDDCTLHGRLRNPLPFSDFDRRRWIQNKNQLQKKLAYHHKLNDDEHIAHRYRLMKNTQARRKYKPKLAPIPSMDEDESLSSPYSPRLFEYGEDDVFEAREKEKIFLNERSGFRGFLKRVGEMASELGDLVRQTEGRGGSHRNHGASMRRRGRSNNNIGVGALGRGRRDEDDEYRMGRWGDRRDRGGCGRNYSDEGNKGYHNSGEGEELMRGRRDLDREMGNKKGDKENRRNNGSKKENRSNNRSNKENRSNNRSNKEKQRNKLMQMSDRSLKRIYQELRKNQKLHSSGGRGGRREEERRNEDGWIEDGRMEKRMSKNNSNYSREGRRG